MFTEETVKLTVDHMGQTRAMLEDLIEEYLAATGTARRTAGRQIREIARAYPTVADQIPDAIWREVYRVSARGTVAP